jgi:hypothetical protein
VPSCLFIRYLRVHIHITRDGSTNVSDATHLFEVFFFFHSDVFLEMRLSRSMLIYTKVNSQSKLYNLPKKHELEASWSQYDLHLYRPNISQFYENSNCNKFFRQPSVGVNICKASDLLNDHLMPIRTKSK